MKHKKCGGVFIKMVKEERRTVYQCNKCSKIMSIYTKQTATSGNQKEVSK